MAQPDSANQYFLTCLKYSQEKSSQKYDHAKNYVDGVFNSILQSTDYIYSNFVEGDIAEFGVGFGVTANALSYASKGAATYFNLPLKKLWLFDSFEGLPPFESDLDRTTHWEPGWFKGKGVEEIKKICLQHIEEQFIEIFPGWFKETLLKIPKNTLFSLVHIDSDLYLSAKSVLEFLFANRCIAKGGVVLFDDWNCNQAKPNLGERRAWQEIVEDKKISFSNWGAYGAFGQRFIVHNYM